MIGLAGVIVSLLPVAALISLVMAVRNYRRSRNLAASGWAGTGFGIVAILFGLAAFGHKEPSQIAVTPSERPIDPLEDDARFDLIDMLPARAGGLMLTVAYANTGSLKFPRESDSQEANGKYDWIRRPGDRVDLVPMAIEFRSGDAATISCYRIHNKDASVCSDRGARPMKIMGKLGCFYAEQSKCGIAGLGASVQWDGCSVDFKCGTRGLSMATVAPIADDVARWVSWFRSGRGPEIPRAEVHNNRAELLPAIAQWRLRH